MLDFSSLWQNGFNLFVLEENQVLPTVIDFVEPPQVALEFFDNRIFTFFVLLERVVLRAITAVAPLPMVRKPIQTCISLRTRRNGLKIDDDCLKVGRNLILKLIAAQSLKASFVFSYLRLSIQTRMLTDGCKSNA